MAGSLSPSKIKRLLRSKKGEHFTLGQEKRFRKTKLFGEGKMSKKREKAFIEQQPEYEAASAMGISRRMEARRAAREPEFRKALERTGG